MTPYEEALRRIAEAKERGAELLDLGDLRLKELPRELGSLTCLRVLALGKFQPYFDAAGELKWNWIEDRPLQLFTNLDPVRPLSDLTSLDITGCAQVKSIDALSGLKRVTSLDLSGF